MTEESVSSTAVTPAVVTQAPAVVSSPSVAVVADAGAAPSAPTQVVNPAPSAEAVAAPVTAPAVVTPIVETTKTSTLLDAPVAEVKADAPVEAKTDKQVDGQSEKTAQSPTYEAFKLPEGVTFDNEKLSEFMKDLGELQGKTKAEKAVMQEFGQKLMDRHVAELQKTIQLVQEQNKIANETKVKSWDESFRKDPEIGGNKQDTTLNVARSAIKYAGNEAQQKEFRQLLQDTGAYAHPAMIRTLANFQNKINELESKYNSENGIKPLVATVPMTPVKGKADKMYGKMQ